MILIIYYFFYWKYIKLYKKIIITVVINLPIDKATFDSYTNGIKNYYNFVISNMNSTMNSISGDFTIINGSNSLGGNGRPLI